MVRINHAYLSYALIVGGLDLQLSLLNLTFKCQSMCGTMISVFLPWFFDPYQGKFFPQLSLIIDASRTINCGNYLFQIDKFFKSLHFSSFSKTYFPR